MTVEEAIKILEDERGYMINHAGTPQIEAFTMAIKALEQQPCGDCVSRKAIINIIKYTTMSEYLSDILIDKVDKLPSVTPTQWHKAEDELPKINQFVLCKCRAGITEVLKLTVDGWYHDIDHCYMDGFVIAWTELPEWEE